MQPGLGGRFDQGIIYLHIMALHAERHTSVSDWALVLSCFPLFLLSPVLLLLFLSAGNYTKTNLGPSGNTI